MSDACNPAIALVCDKIRWYVIGFVILSVHDNVEYGESGGSGTLVTINDVRGILTAAHVAKNLQEHSGEVGIVRFLSSPTLLQSLKLPMDCVRTVRLEKLPWTCTGPDLAFLTLPPSTESSLTATNNFYDLGSKPADVLASEFPAGKYFSCIAGVVHERTTEVSVFDRSANTRLFEALCEPGNVSNLTTEGGFDLLDFDAKPYDDHLGPTSYEGVSGAALWRVYCDEDSEGKPTQITKLWLHGVAFCEERHDSRVPTIRCHGPISVFDILLSEVERSGSRNEVGNDPAR